MSVITRRLGAKDLTVYCKGSPEMIQSLSRPETGVYKIILYFSTEIAFSVSKYLIHQYPKSARGFGVYRVSLDSILQNKGFITKQK